ncbi:MAG: VCBS repeat-containing protein [Moorea sp. SIO3I7]|uniref:FG-GAP repeat domain-containing protein n=1 Tax=unclassified Moorena TaxID=2683338 RepID=UPI0013C22BBA|nr:MULTISPECIES: VCBS repeat-containing protein [unclassified Moorena]NEN97332.1 VCBS repeat-containing protein [Moorena sp. SIO3I7]NEO08521.1 VCBS repeat-containing protein [Moorena sp. SIO3I8]NEP25567.1 VCBS repeat-containing protein [Moorena sp. SIO3I6]
MTLFATKKLAINSFSPLKGGWTNFNTYPRQLGDVNGDGRDDIVGFGHTFVYVSLGQSDGTFASPSIALDSFTVDRGRWTDFDTYPRQLGDVNGDGRDDIVGFGHTFVYVSLGQSDGTFASPSIALDSFTVDRGRWTDFDTYPRQLGDVNGDGRDDIVGFGHTFVFVSLGQSDGTFAPPSIVMEDFTVDRGGWTNFDTYPRQLGDVNGDGQADIVGFANNGTYVALANNPGVDPLLSIF